MKNNIRLTYPSVTHNITDNKLFKSFEWASSIMANVPVCHAEKPSSILGSSTVTIYYEN